MIKKIVVIEDDPDVALVLKDLFDAMGYDGRFFIDGERALNEVNSILPDMVIMDLMLPKISGFMICQKLKESVTTRNIPLIAITGYDSRENRRKIFASGIDDYLPKPFDLAVLKGKIENLISK